MCGYLSWISKTEINDENFRASLRKMDHRGPDDEGFFFTDDRHVAFGHKRLSIIDPKAGQQPMKNSTGDIVVIFNGAVYNFLEIRQELISEGYPLKTFSDTEVIIYAYEKWGEGCVERFNGMFSFVIYDKKKQRIFAARDRVGIKPFYYYSSGKDLIIASEIKAILECDAVDTAVDQKGLVDYLSFQFYLRDKTLFRSINRLEPGHRMLVDLTKDEIKPEISKYWDVRIKNDNSLKTEEDYLEIFMELLNDSIRLRLRADVPLGAHLSGGLDSSTVASLNAAMLDGKQIQTFTGRFDEGTAFDESYYAKMVANKINAQYHDILIDHQQFRDNFEKIVWHMDEPEAGPGVFPQFMVSQYAKDHVKVILGGQGGDELCVGYVRYLVAYYEEQMRDAILGDNAAVNNISNLSEMLYQLDGYQPMMKEQYASGLFGESFDRYYKLVNRMDSLQGLINGDVFSAANYSPYEEMSGLLDQSDFKNSSYVNQMTYLDFKTSLQGLLHVEDRTSMASSIESRVPLLDHRIAEFIFNLPMDIKFKNGELKYFFKKAIKNILPDEVLNRKDKKGFPTPLNIWLKGPLNDWVKEILNDKRTKERGIFERKSLETMVESEGMFNRSVWGVLNLELWHRQFIDK
ncbi:MAG: asparagine synthase (glutamine-hydrolyzing) [Deferribacterales bacterium]